MSLRLAVARQQGLDEAMADKVDHFEGSDLPEEHKVALRFATALMTLPGIIGDELRADLRVYFTTEQIVELALDVTKWSTQKIQVSLGLDAPVNPGGLAELNFEDDGRAVIGGPIRPPFPV